MLISVTSNPVGACPTETQGLIIKSEHATVVIFDKKKRAKKRMFYSADQVLSCMTEMIFHN